MLAYIFNIHTKIIIIIKEANLNKRKKISTGSIHNKH